MGGGGLDICRELLQFTEKKKKDERIRALKTVNKGGK